MTELSGTLAGVGLPAIVRFLQGLKKTGRLCLTQDDWSGQVDFVAGDVTNATLGSRTGLPALDGMLELFPDAEFTFEPLPSDAPTLEWTVRLSQDDLLARLDQGAERIARNGRRLPRPDAVPAQINGDGSGEEPLPLDRGTLQTLLAVDGHRSVREIVAMRQSIESLWHLAGLAEVGLISFNGHVSAAPQAPAEFASAVAPDPQATIVVPRPAPTGPPAEDADADSFGRCPKLGFEDDPSSSFSRPTRLHRCFAAGTSMPLSLDQQRELCLSDQFGTCPRLTGVQAQTTAAPRIVPGPRRPQPSASGDPRIVRLPFAARQAAAAGEAARNAASEPTPLRPATPPAAEETPARTASAVRPTPFRARLERPSTAAAAAGVAGASSLASSAVVVPREPPAAAPPPPTTPPPLPRHEQARAAAQSESQLTDNRRRIGQIPVVALAAAGVAVLLVAAIAYLLLPQIFGDNNLDPNTLPNARLVEEGTPVTALAPPRATPVVAAGAVPKTNTDAAGAQAAPVVAPAQPTQVAAAEQPTVPPEASPVATATSPSSAPVAALLDERFASNAANWPSNPQGLAQFANGSYRIGTRQAGQGAAIGAPIANVPADVLVTADFRKLDGPDGGGYGIIVRDQQSGVRDGASQDGQYYVLEVGDKGEVGIWRRDGDHWVDLLPWQRSDAVRPGTASNELTVRAVGNNLSLSVNGTEVATRTDSTLASGQVGVFIGGDGNQVALTRFTVQNP